MILRCIMFRAPQFIHSSRIRIFLSVGGVMFLGLYVFFFHGTQMKLEEVRKVSDKCHQQQESLAAQLQVAFEYKLRLEKSLQQEKAEHRQTKEQYQQWLEEEKELREKQNLKHINKYSSLQQQYKILNNLLLECQGKCDPRASKKDSENVLSNRKDVSSNKVSTDKIASGPVVPAVHHDHGKWQKSMNVLPGPDANHLSGDKVRSSSIASIIQKGRHTNITPPINDPGLEPQENIENAINRIQSRLEDLLRDKKDHSSVKI